MSKFFKARPQQGIRNDPSDPAFIKCLANNRTRERAFQLAHTNVTLRRSLFGDVFPKTYHQLRQSALLPYVDLSHELSWTAATLRFFSKELCAIVTAIHNYERALFHGDFHQCEILLTNFTAQFGTSLWLLKNQILLKTYTKDSDAARSFSETIASDPACELSLRFFARYLGIRIEQSGSPSRFLQMIAKLVVDSKRTNPTNFRLPYVEYHLAFYSERKISDYLSILRAESTSALVDRYLTFLRIGQLIFSTREQSPTHNALKEALISLGSHIEETPLSTLQSCMGISVQTPYSVSPELIEAIDAYTTGAYDKACLSAAHLIKQFPEEFAPYELVAKASLRGSLEISNIGLPANVISLVSAMRSLITADEQSRQSHEVLWRFIVNHEHCSWAAQGFLFLQKEFNHFGRPLPKHYLAFAELNSYQQPNPRLIHAFYLLGRTPPLVFKQAPSAKTITGRVQEARQKACNQSEFEEYLRRIPLPSDRRTKLMADFLFEHRSYISALKLYEKLDSTPTSHAHYSALVGRIRCLIESKQVLACINLTSPILINKSTAWAKLPLGDIIEAAVKSNEPSVWQSLGLATILGFYSKHVGSQYDVLMVDVCEDYLAKQEVSNPSDIVTPADSLQREELIFFLKNVCIPTILDSLDASSGTTAVQRWRLEICQKILEIDQNNIERRRECETEIKDLTKALATKKGLAAVEQSLIHVEVDGLRKILAIALSENYRRYCSMITDASVTLAYLYVVKRGGPDRQNELGAKFAFSGFELFDILNNMVLEVRDAFTSNPEFGLNSSLSMGIRHGTLEGHIRRLFEQLNLVTRRDSKDATYLPNQYWLQRVSFPSREVRDRFKKRLDAFSAEVDTYIGNIVDQKIQIRTEVISKEEAFFDFRISDAELLVFLKQARKDTPMDVFIDMVMDRLWHIADESLKKARYFFSTQAAPPLVRMLETLRNDIASLLGPSAHVELEANLTNACNEIHDRMNRIGSWFTRSVSEEMAGYDLESAINLAKAMVENVHRGLVLDLQIGRLDNFPLRPRAVKPLYNVFYNLFDNIRKYSAQTYHGPGVTFSAEATGNVLTLRIINTIGDHVDIGKVKESISEVVALANDSRLLSRGSLSKVGVEGKSGFSKIAKILYFEIGTTYELELACSETEFSVTIKLQKDKVAA